MIALSAITYHEADMCHGMCGKKEPSTTIVQREEVNRCLMQPGSTFQRTCLLQMSSECCLEHVKAGGVYQLMHYDQHYKMK